MPELSSWNDTPTRSAIVDFVERVTKEGGSEFVPPEERVATFDNDGTLWCEKPMLIEYYFVLERLAEMAEADASLREKQPWKAARDQDRDWFGEVFPKHYQGDDTDMKVLTAGMLRAFAGESVEEYAAAADAFLRGGTHPTLGLGFLSCVYLPMVELLQYLEANGFTTYIASGGDRDFVRPITEDVYSIPAERVIGTVSALSYLDDEHGVRVAYAAEPDVFDDGPQKPVRIWSRTGRRPILAGGNTNGDVPMLRFAGGGSRPVLRLLVLHDDPDREFDYTAGVEKALEHAAAEGWTVVSMKDDWATVFGGG